MALWAERPDAGQRAYSPFRPLVWPEPVSYTHLDVYKRQGVGHVMDRSLQKLSKGEQRLVLLARALVKNPPLLILDEPCQGLDIGAVEYFRSVVDVVCGTDERTLIYVSHYPHEIPVSYTHLDVYKRQRILLAIFWLSSMSSLSISWASTKSSSLSFRLCSLAICPTDRMVS